MEEEIVVRFLDQTFVKIDKSLSLIVELDNKNIKHKFYLFDTMKHPVVLGLDFLKISGITVDFTSAKIHEIHKKLKSIIVILDDTLTIKGKDFTKIGQKLDKHVKSCEFVANKENETKYNIRFVLLPIQLVFNQIIIKISNLNFSKLTLPKGLVLGILIPSVEPEEQILCYQTKNENKTIELNVIIKDPKLLQLLQDFEFIFAADIGELKRATNIKHIIDTGEHEPIRSVPYRTSQKEREIIKKEVEKMLENGIIRVSESPWSSPVVIVPKKDGSIRFCIDYRRLNKITTKDSGPLPLIADTLDALNDSKIFTKMDLKSGYWSISMSEESKQKTAFCCHLGLFEFNVLPFGLTNSPATFQRYLQTVLNDLLWHCCLVYIDDVIVFSPSMEQHVEHVRQVLDRLAKHQLRLNAEKCEFATTVVTYLGHVVTPEGISPDPDKTKSIEEFPRPLKVKDVRSFLGLSSYYRRFVEGYSRIAKPMNLLLKKNQPFKWNDKCELSFQELKHRLISPPILAHFKPECPIILFTDCSGYAMGAILSQIHEGKEVVISYNSKSLDERQSQYCISEREALAIVWAVQKLRPYLYGAHFTIKSDHCALCYIMAVRNPNGRLVRWSLFLQDYDFTVEFKSGVTHRNVDCLSRYPVEEAEHDIEEAEHLLTEDINIAELQSTDKWCQQIVSEITEKKNKKYISGYRIENGILYRTIYSSNNESKKLLCVPKNLRKRILEELHDSKLSGHLGFLKTYTKIRERFYWNRMERTVRQYVRNCVSCQERKSDTGPPKGSLQPIEYPIEPFYQVAMDIVGQLTETPRKNRYIICLIDFNTRWLEAKPLKNMRSETIADFFVNEILVRHGAVVRVLTDQGRNFCSEFMEEVYKFTKSQHLVTTPYKPSTNGLIERSIRTMRSMMSHFIDENHSNWDLYLKYLVFAYNSSKQATTGETPFMLLYGREPRLPIDVSLNLPSQFTFVEKYKSSLNDCRQFIKTRVEAAQQKMKDEYDAKHFNTIYKVGDLVALHKKNRELGKTEKLYRNFKGPYLIKRRIGLVSYELQNPKYPKRKLKKAHISRIKKWNEEAIEGIDGPDILEKIGKTGRSDTNEDQNRTDAGIVKLLGNSPLDVRKDDDPILQKEASDVSKTSSGLNDDSRDLDLSDAKQMDNDSTASSSSESEEDDDMQ